MPGPDQKDLPSLAHHLLTAGPFKTHPGNRRVRIVLGSSYIADSISPLFVWEHAAYPQFYVPRSAFDDGAVSWDVLQDIDDGGAHVCRLTLKSDGRKSTEKVIHFLGGGPLKDLVKVDFASVDQWLEEDTPISVHPKDPFKRVDLLISTRPIKISLNGHVLASTDYAVHLHETNLPTRYYMPLTAIKIGFLKHSSTRTQCPYKGEAEYYDLVLPDGQEFKNLVWYYTRPTIECAGIQGLCCFYNEKVDVEVDGKKEERPNTWFS